jgi:anti-sigma B factor antagonist
MEVTGLGDGLTKITLSGRLDTPGVDRIETHFVAAVVPSGKHAIVDLSRVEFVASMGLRMFISVARSMSLRHAKLVLYGAPPMVHEVFETVSLSEVVPVVADETEAMTAVSS